MAVNPSSLGGPKPQFELSDGTPAVGCRLFFYVAGSVGTKQNTYTDSTGGSANTNPVVLNALGMPTTQIWFTAGQSYKAVYAPPGSDDPPNSPIFTVDNLYGINDVTVAQDQWVSGPAPTFVSATSFTLVGDQTSTFHVGRRVKTTNSGGTAYSTISASAFGALTTITVVNDSTVLDSGLSAVSYGLLSNTNFSVPALRAAGDWLGLNAAGTLARIPASATVAAHATTCDVWTARETILSGGAVTFTDIADAPFVGAVAWVYMNAAHIWTDGAVFDVQGGATYTTAIGDWVRINAVTVSTFDVTIFPASGAAVGTVTGTSASTFTFDGAGGTSSSTTMTYQKVGNFVTLHLPAVSATSGTGSTTFTSNTALPAAIRPAAATQNNSLNNILDNAATGTTAGVATISTAGVIVIKKTGSATAWTNTAAGGTAEGNTFTYFVG